MADCWTVVKPLISLLTKTVLLKQSKSIVNQISCGLLRLPNQVIKRLKICIVQKKKYCFGAIFFISVWKKNSRILLIIYEQKKEKKYSLVLPMVEKKKKKKKIFCFNTLKDY